jgi:hypothetical protein
VPEKSQKSNFQSAYGGGYISAAQYLAEVACERIAAKDKKALPPKFWNLDSWKKIFLMQIRFANSLLKLYAPQAIVAAFRRSKNVYSLGAKFWDKALEEEQVKYERFATLQNTGEASKQEKEGTPIIEEARPAFVEKPSLRDKLRDL